MLCVNALSNNQPGAFRFRSGIRSSPPWHRERWSWQTPCEGLAPSPGPLWAGRPLRGSDLLESRLVREQRPQAEPAALSRWEDHGVSTREGHGARLLFPPLILVTQRPGLGGAAHRFGPVSRYTALGTQVRVQPSAPDVVVGLDAGDHHGCETGGPPHSDGNNTQKSALGRL